VLEEDKYIAERAETILKKGEMKLGIVSSSRPTWVWHVGTLGTVVWMRSPEDLFVRNTEDPPWRKEQGEQSELSDVDAILVQGNWPELEDPIWKMQTLQVAIKVVVSRRKPGGKSTSQSLPEGWTSYQSYKLCHTELGGVTNGRFTVEVRSRCELTSSVQVLPPRVSGKLGEALSMMEGGRNVALGNKGDSNTASGILDWRHMKKAGKVKTPSIYYKDGGVERTISVQEMTRILDFPGTRTRQMTDQQLKILTDTEIPGKIIYASIYFLSTWNKERRTNKEAEQEQSNVDKIKNDDERCSEMPRNTRDVTHNNMERGTVNEARREAELNEELAQDYEYKDSVTEHVRDKATRSDDSSIPFYLWNERVVNQLNDHWTSRGMIPQFDVSNPHEILKVTRALRLLRIAATRYWKRSVQRCFDTWYEEKGRHCFDHKDIRIAGDAAVAKAARASWWEWSWGSTIFYWRWPPDYQDVVRKGVAPMFDSEPPTNNDRQPPYEDEAIRLKVKEKLDKVICRGYVELCDIKFVEAMMFMFDVKKGPTDIRMVYDGSKSGLNKALWAPWFSLPTIDTMSRWVLAGAWLADNDYGDFFLNFPLHADLQKYCGVDLTQLFPELKGEASCIIVGRWLRNAMGLRPSPYCSIQGGLRAKRIILGDPDDPANPFQWDSIEENLPCSEGYNASLPWITKVRKDKMAAADIAQYVDDVRVVAPTSDIAWRCSSAIAKTASYLGLQDAARKRRPQSQRPGAWAGATIAADTEVVTKAVTQERWEKLQHKIRWIAKQLGLTDKYTPENFDDVSPEVDRGAEGMIHFKTTEQFVGFVVYVSMTYKSLVPYLKGIYLTLNSYRPDRDEWGWGIPQKKVKGAPRPNLPYEKPPEWVEVKPRLKHDMQALMELTRHDEPPDIPIRATNTKAMFLVGDASGAGFGSSSWEQGSDEVHADFGKWMEDVTDNESSNFREAANLVIRLKRMLKSGELKKGTEVFVFTDNQVAESTYFRGSAKNSKLHQLILGLRKLEMEGQLIIHFVWMAGTRMIEQGSDGLSRSEFSSGVMTGEDFLKYLPLNETAFERQPHLKSMMKGWLPGDEWKFATTKDWFHEVFKDPNGAFIWAPPPALARVAVDQLCEVKHIFPNSKHVFVCPALMTGYWRKQLGKLADTLFTIKEDTHVWRKGMHEPLTFAFVLPLLSTSPWKASRLERVVNWQSKVSKVQWKNSRAIRNHMRELWLSVERKKDM
jgi:hypothetical protein